MHRVLANMKYAITFAGISVVLLAASQAYTFVNWLLIWAAISFALVALAYAGIGPRVFGKSADGRISILFKLIHLPYFALTWTTWHLCRFFSTESAFNKIDEGLMIGRRLLPNEVPHQFDHYIDLTAEFEEPRDISVQIGYYCLPILDGGIPSFEQLQRTVEDTSEGTIFVHCAQGHGRTGLFALARLLHRGSVLTVEDGIKVLQSLRPAVNLNREQTAFAHRYLQAKAEQPDAGNQRSAGV